jgi:hypothetical protein|tara:strand:+ start:879 stop:1100 length:222 start_codon:yes stop_codon:yes gene_type:complete
MKKTKTKNTPVKYTEKALAYFQEMNDQDEFMTEPVNGDYVDYLLGDMGNNSYQGTQMDTEFEDLGDDSDWFMD